MKFATTLSLAAMTALFIGCGGSGSDNTSSVATGGNTSSTASNGNTSVLENSTTLFINNNVSESTYSILDTNYGSDYARYDSDSALHCPDYGYTTLMAEDIATSTAPAAKSYMRNTHELCIEYDFSNNLDMAGSKYLAFYK
jgi:hypothetical protein